jgi:hypothetical protein
MQPLLLSQPTTFPFPGVCQAQPRDVPGSGGPQLLAATRPRACTAWKQHARGGDVHACVLQLISCSLRRCCAVGMGQPDGCRFRLPLAC